ncbi:ATP-binding protein [Agromyces bauzanensis]
MDRRWVCLATFGPIGVASVAYVVIISGFIEGNAAHELGWLMLGVLPTFVFAMWLLTVSSSRAALYLALASTAMAFSSAYEIFVRQNVELLQQPWFPLFNMLGLTADGVSTAAFVALFATFPTGVPERRWQRTAVWFIWIPALVGPLAVLTIPELLMSPYMGVTGAGIPNQYAVPWLEWAAPIVYFVAYQPWPSVVLGLGILCYRTLFGDPEVRARTRVMAGVVTASLLAFAAWTLWPQIWIFGVAVFVTLFAIPLAGIHGILRYGAFDIAPGDRGRLFARSSGLLIAVLYGIGVAVPAVLLGDSMTLVGAVLLTALFAVALLPVRGWLQRRIHRLVFGDRERQLTMLGDLGTRLEQAVDPRELLTRLAEAVQEGLDASWVRIALAGPDGSLAASPIGVAGDVGGEVAASCDLVRGDETLGRIDVGARRRGEYSDAERTLLRTVAGQAAASVANVRLTAQLAEQLEELTASRERLVAAQDDERRRLERDLHDGIQQNVVAQIAGLRLARNRLQRGELTAEELIELQDQARETLTDLRELARGIHPPVLSDNGLVAAVESGVARYPIPLTVEADAATRAERYPADVETTAYYVVREALANTAKHAHATRASVALARSNGHLRIAIIDDGCGIDSSSAASLTGSAARGGLANIRDRVAALRGTVRVSSNGSSSTGTTVLVELPVDGVAPAAGPGREVAPVG